MADVSPYSTPLALATDIKKRSLLTGVLVFLMWMPYLGHCYPIMPLVGQGLSLIDKTKSSFSLPCGNNVVCLHTNYTTNVMEIRDKIGMLTILSTEVRGKHRFARVRCECGKEKEVQYGNLTKKFKPIISCGCYAPIARRERILKMNREDANPNKRHGHNRKGHVSRTYRSYYNMIDRCHNPKNISFYNYGGRGIAVCQEWRDSFVNFLKDMGESMPGMTIDRVNTNKGYCKENCKWSTPTEQNRNRRNTVMLPYKGKVLPMATIAETEGIKYTELQYRIKVGMTADEAIPLIKRLNYGGA